MVFPARTSASDIAVVDAVDDTRPLALPLLGPELFAHNHRIECGCMSDRVCVGSLQVLVTLLETSDFIQKTLPRFRKRRTRRQPPAPTELAGEKRGDLARRRLEVAPDGRRTLVGKADYVAVEAALRVPRPKHLFAPRHAELALRRLEPRLPLVFRKLVGNIERGRVGAHHHLGPDAERVDRRARPQQLLDSVLIQIAA